MEDGLLGQPNLLFIKGTMDLSSAFLAPLGRGVLWSAAEFLGSKAPSPSLSWRWAKAWTPPVN